MYDLVSLMTLRVYTKVSLIWKMKTPILGLLVITVGFLSCFVFFICYYLVFQFVKILVSMLIIFPSCVDLW